MPVLPTARHISGLLQAGKCNLVTVDTKIAQNTSIIHMAGTACRLGTFATKALKPAVMGVVAATTYTKKSSVHSI